MYLVRVFSRFTEEIEEEKYFENLCDAQRYYEEFAMFVLLYKVQMLELKEKDWVDIQTKSCENCDWRSSVRSTANQYQIREGLWCTLPDSLFEKGDPCELWQKQEYPIPRGEWVGPQWNY